MSTIPEISVAPGDGIGPEITDAVVFILKEAGARVSMDHITIGKQIYEQGISSGISDQAWESIRRTKVLLKGPITTPQGGGYKSVNVTARKTLGLFANVRPVRSFAPFVKTPFPGMDLVIVRENEEDTYGGIEHQQTDEVVQCLKLITRPGTERVVRYAFEYAVANQRKKVHCLSKDNIMKLTDGLFHKVFNEIATEYPTIQNDHMIIDIGTAKVASDPLRFDVIVTPNLYGDIISDVAAEVSGSVGLAGSANIGVSAAMFEAVHGSAPDIAGQNIANPSGLLNGAILMLLHLGQADVAELIQNAWLTAVEDGMHTRDIKSDTYTKQVLGTKEFAQAVVDRLGKKPHTLAPAVHAKTEIHMDKVLHSHTQASIDAKKASKTLKGVDIFLDWDQENRNPAILGKHLESIAGSDFRLSMISNRGTKVYPDGAPETYCTDHWRCRFVGENPSNSSIVELLSRVTKANLEVIKTENLYEFGGQAGYSKGQGE
jgi:isocitrate dehydrogenase